MKYKPYQPPMDLEKENNNMPHYPVFPQKRVKADPLYKENVHPRELPAKPEATPEPKKTSPLVEAKQEEKPTPVLSSEAELYKSLIDKRYNKIIDFLSVLVNGDPINQLFIKYDLTEEAKNELIMLQEETRAKKIAASKLELDSLEKKVGSLKEELNKLTEEIEQKKKEEEGYLSKIALLEKKHKLLSDFINFDLSRLVDVMKEPVVEQEDEYEWKWQPTCWDYMYNEAIDTEIMKFDEYIDRRIEEFAKYTNCSLEKARAQFYNISPQIPFISKYLKNPPEELSKYNTFHEWFDSSGILTDERKMIERLFKGIRIPLYEITKVKVKKIK